jgi:hypothetical protein
MAYKESIAYSRDLIKGTNVEVLKKKLILPYTGTATVKLYDSLTGRQTYEAKSENRISAIFGNIAYLNGFYYPILDNNSSSLLYEIYSTLPFRMMALTTGDVSEDPYDYFTWGNIVGYADGVTPYSGSDNFRGTVNESETTRTTGKKHYVIDFPTNAANGTFKSIYWTGGYPANTPTAPKLNYTYAKKTLEKGTYSTSLSAYNLCTDESNLYVLKINSATIYVYDKATYEKKENIIISEASIAIAYDGTNFWSLLSTGAFRKLDKQFNVINSYSRSSVISSDIAKSLTFYDIEADEANVYISYGGYIESSGSSAKGCIAKYDKDGVFNSKSDLYSDYAYKIALSKITNNKLLVVINEAACMHLNDNLTVHGSIKSNLTGYKSFTWDNDTSTIFTYTSNSYGELKHEYIIPAAAHTLLPEPVTKTPTNTMKIQYDFTCEYVYMLDMPPH